jgi:hypothetical protein
MRHLRPVAAPFRKNKVMHRMFNVDTFLILVACGVRRGGGHPPNH